MAKETNLKNQMFSAVANAIVIAGTEFKKELEKFICDEHFKSKKVDLDWIDEVNEEWEEFILKYSKELKNKLEENPTLKFLTNVLILLEADVSNKKEILFSKVRYCDEDMLGSKKDNQERELTFHEYLDFVKKGFVNIFDEIGEEFDKLENKPESSKYRDFIIDWLDDSANKIKMYNVFMKKHK